MKSLKFADLKGTKTAVNCRTQEEWDKVTAICGYEWGESDVWRHCMENSFISLEKKQYAGKGWYESKGFTIIPASHFILANTQPKAVKLPVTVEEVWEEEEKKMQKRDSFKVGSHGEITEDYFSQTKLIREFRKESTAEKSRAFDTLLKIAEAQNELVERGESAYAARLMADGEIRAQIVKPFYGQIVFNSCEGLKDCIEANRELWMDLLKSE